MHYFAHFLFSKIVTPHSFLCPASAHPADTLWLFLIFLDLRFFKVQGIYFTGRFRDFWMTSGGFPHMAKAPQKEECPADTICCRQADLFEGASLTIEPPTTDSVQ